MSIKSFVSILLVFVLGSFGSSPAIASVIEGARHITITHSHHHHHEHGHGHEATHEEDEHSSESSEAHSHTVLLVNSPVLFVQTKAFVNFNFEFCTFYPESYVETLFSDSYTGSIFRPPISV